MTRTGFGFDIHRLEEGRKLMLGGIEIPHSKGLSGHSDADALLHAIIDSLLGAAGLGDIGELYSDQDPKNKDLASSKMLHEVMRRLQQLRFKLVHLDTVIMAEEPKLSPYKPKLRSSLAKLMGLEECAVNVKAKTFERLGPIGQGEAIAAYSVATLKKQKS